MRFRNRLLLFIAIVAGVSAIGEEIAWAWPRVSSRIEAVRGRQYRLTKRHGPWMIMVANFREPPPELKTDGMTPREAADELVFELRKKGIPAYTFSQDDVIDQVQTYDRMGRLRQRNYMAQQGSVSVLAGNYANADDKVAQKTLVYVKRFHPKFLRNVAKSGKYLQKLSNGGIWRKTPGRPGPLSGAFLSFNPVLTPEEIQRKKRDPLLLKLNSGMENSLLENNGKFSLIVASFYGKSVTQVSSSKFRQRLKDFKVDNTLDEAAMDAWELAKAMRELGLEAYVYHEKYRSIVTVGAFDSPRNPRIIEFRKIYGAKIKKNPLNGQNVLVGETFTIPLRPPPNTVADKKWIFDPYPKLMEVPHL